MNRQNINLNSLTLVGITTRTNNKNEMNPATAKIGEISHVYWSRQLAHLFKNRANPNVTYGVYTDYESDEHGEYTYFMGEAVTSLTDQDMTQFYSLIIPASNYEKFTTDTGKMPAIIINAWRHIWQINFAGMRTYRADFEVYDQRASNPDRAVIDIYIGVK